MTDWEGNMVEEKHHVRILLSEVSEDQEMSAAAVISSAKNKVINLNLDHQYYNSVFTSVSHDPCDVESLSTCLNEKLTESQFKMTVGLPPIIALAV